MVEKAPFRAALLHPKYWPYWLGMWFLRLLIILPLKWQYKLGQVIGALFMRLANKRRLAAQKNIAVCLPELSQAEQEQMLRQHFSEVGMALFDTANAWWWSDQRIRRHFEWHGLEHIDQARKEGHGVLMLGAHSLVLETGARGFNQYHPGIGIYRAHSNPIMEYFQTKGRLRSAVAVINKKDIRSMVKVLRKRHVLWYSQDQDAGSKGIFVPFFGVLASTPAGAHTLAKLGKAKVLPFFTERKADHSGYKIIVSAPLKNFPSDDVYQDTLHGNQVTEQLIRQRPEQYMWLHRRFKTRPDPNEPKFYD